MSKSFSFFQPCGDDSIILKLAPGINFPLSLGVVISGLLPALAQLGEHTAVRFIDGTHVWRIFPLNTLAYQIYISTIDASCGDRIGQDGVEKPLLSLLIDEQVISLLKAEAMKLQLLLAPADHAAADKTVF